MKRLLRLVIWVGIVTAALWVTRAALKRWIDGPEVTSSSGGWPERPGPATTAAPGSAASPGAAPVSTAPPPAQPAPPSAGTTSAPPAEAAGKKAAGKRAASKRRKDLSPPGSWVVPNGSADVLVTYPVKAKLASRVYRVPGMAMYDRTVADRCYATVEAAEADGFNRAAR